MLFTRLVRDLEALASGLPRESSESVTTERIAAMGAFRKFPRYAEPLEGAQRLFDDFQAVISETLSEEARTFARLLYRLPGADACLSAGDDESADEARVDLGKLESRWDAIAVALGKNKRLMQGEMKWRVLGELAFQLSRLGEGQGDRFYHSAGQAYRAVRHDWSAHISDGLLRETFSTLVEAHRPDQRLFVVGQELEGGTIRSCRAQADGGPAHYVGHAQAGHDSTLQRVMHVVYLAHPFFVGVPERVTLTIELATPRPREHFLCQVVSPVDEISLTVTSDGPIPNYERVDRPVSPEFWDDPVGHRKRIKTGEDGALTYEIKPPATGRIYELCWGSELHVSE